MMRKDRIEGILQQEIGATHIEVIDESAKHAGHSGSRPGGETHYRVIISGGKLDGLSRIACHRLINNALDSEFASGMHALAIEIG